MLGAALLFVSLFLTWSHQPSRLQGVPADATAWQVYTYADVLLALLAAGLVVAALRMSPTARLGAAAVVAAALAFVAHAVAVPPSDVGVTDVRAAAGVGETIALIGLVLALAGLTLGERLAIYVRKAPRVLTDRPSQAPGAR